MDKEIEDVVHRIGKFLSHELTALFEKSEAHKSGGGLTTKHELEKLMTALETLNDSIIRNTASQNRLTAAVNAAIIRIGTPTVTDAQLLTASGAIDANTVSDDNASTALENALGAPAPVTTPALGA